MTQGTLDNTQQLNTFWRILSISKEEVLPEASSALISDLLAYPVHTIWTAQQESSARQTLSFFKTCQHIKKDGMRYHDFYKGFSISGSAAVIGIFPYLAGAKCSIALFGDNHIGQLMQGPFSQIFAAPINVPAMRLIELEQASISSTNNLFKQLSAANKAKKIWLNEGVCGFYRGALPHVFINSVSDALGFWMRARILSYYTEGQKKQVMPQLLATWFSFGTAYAATTPFAIAETRLRIHEINPAAFPDKTFFSSMRTLCQRGGLFRGALASGLYGMVSSLPIACEAVVSPN